MTTPRFQIPELTASQAQKHVTHNDALAVIDAAMNLNVINATTTAPPGSPSEGDKYIPLATATGAWAGHENDIALFTDGGWIFFAPVEGWRCYDPGTNSLLLHNGANWGRKIYDNENILGTVAQSGGTPTGAVIERGSNANGRYVRWADGTQLCQRTVTIDVEVATKQDFTYPAAFAGVDTGAWSYSNDSPNIAIRPANIRSVAAFNGNWSVRLVSTGTAPDPTTSKEQLRLEAWGRWL